MPAFYRSDKLLVTGQLIVVCDETVISLRPDAIDHLQVVRNGAPVSRQITLGQLWPAAIASVLPLLTIANDPIGGRLGVLGLVVTLTLVGSLPALAFITGRRHAVYGLWAVVGDRRICLLRNSNRRTLKQVRHAVTRTRELRA
jgi:hypothetical protein